MAGKVSVTWVSAKILSPTHRAAAAMVEQLVRDGVSRVPPSILRPSSCPACGEAVARVEASGAAVYKCRCGYEQPELGASERPSIGMVMMLGVAALYRAVREAAAGDAEAVATVDGKQVAFPPARNRPSQERVIEALRLVKGGMTTRELEEALGLTNSDAGTSVARLVKKGEVADSGRKRERGAVWVAARGGEG